MVSCVEKDLQITVYANEETLYFMQFVSLIGNTVD